MASPRKAKQKASSATAKLSAAIDFVFPAYKETPTLEFQKYCRMGNHQIVAFDGVIALGHPIEEDLAVCPHLGRLRDAIKKAGDTLNMTQLDSGRLSVKGDHLRAIIPCVDPETIPPSMPDPRCAVIDDRIREGMKVVNVVVKEGDANTRWIETCALLRAYSIFATDGKICFEYRHDIDLPPNLTIPKAAIVAITKTDKPLVGFGFSGTTATFYFEDGAWLRTQMFTEQYPDIDRLLSKEIGARGPADLPECPPTLYEAVASVSSFCDGAAVYLGPGVVKSHSAQDVGADYPVEGLTGFSVISHAYVKLIAPYATRLDLNNSPESAIFYGDKVRGVVMKMRG
jgi:hypothetical protein